MSNYEQLMIDSGLLEILLRGAGISIVVSVSVFLFAWFYSLRTKNAGIADLAWAIGFMLIVCSQYFISQGEFFRKTALLVAVSLWSLRLFFYLLARIAREGGKEDTRYAHLRETSKDKEYIFSFKIFISQALLQALLSLPMIIILNQTNLSWNIWDAVAIFIYLCGLTGETIADKQMETFKKKEKESKKQVLDSGLWRYSRHPNYFFEWLIWCSFGIGALASIGISQEQSAIEKLIILLVSLSSPAIMLLMLLRVSGVKITEEVSLKSRGDEYLRYIKSTSAFVPWWPKSETKRTARAASIAYRLLETGMIPDWLIRVAIRRMLASTIRNKQALSLEAEMENRMAFIDELVDSPIAIETIAANEQHYELPSAFFELVLGPRLKYSCALWKKNANSLAEAEEAMLELYCQRAQIADGQKVLDLGCGWGSFSLYAAARFPGAEFKALSNSASQKRFIQDRAALLGLKNLEIITANIAEYEFEEEFDRIVSIEMLEHMKNYRKLLNKLAKAMKPGALLFVHIFTHKYLSYHYENTDGNDWLTENFFTGGTMPSDDLLLYFQDDLKIERHWRVNGKHYEKTANAWLAKMDSSIESIKPILENVYGAVEGSRRLLYWRVFFMACAELWGYKNGEEWLVSHYLMKK